MDASAITVTLTGDGTRRAGKATVKNNRFTATLEALPASETPYELTVAYGDQTVFHLNTVYIGDVFVASGQSNMELNYQQYYGTTAEARKNLGSAFSLSDLPELVDDPGIHFIRAAHTTDSADFPVDPVMGGEWKTCTGTDAQYLGYLPQLFAQRLRTDEPHVPIGIIQTAWGGTPIRDHVPDGRIYKNHIAPLRGMHIAGVIWYQGCNDAWQPQNALDYEARFSTLINDYRTVFEDPQMPFLYVQLARWGGAQYTQYVRQAQLDTLTDPNLKNTANLGMTVTIDTEGDSLGPARRRRAPHRRRHCTTGVPKRHRAGIARDEAGLFALGERRCGGNCHVATGRRVRSGRFQWRVPQGHGLNQWRHRHIALPAGARNQPSAVPVGRRAAQR